MPQDLKTKYFYFGFYSLLQYQQQKLVVGLHELQHLGNLVLEQVDNPTVTVLVLVNPEDELQRNLQNLYHDYMCQIFDLRILLRVFLLALIHSVTRLMLKHHLLLLLYLLQSPLLHNHSHAQTTTKW